MKRGIIRTDSATWRGAAGPAPCAHVPPMAGSNTAATNSTVPEISSGRFAWLITVRDPSAMEGHSIKEDFPCFVK
jgi:hypothetical protein